MEDIAAKAEKVIKSLARDPKGNMYLRANQIRKILAMVVSLTNKITLDQTLHPEGGALSDPLASEVKYLKVKLAYQSGRDRNVRDFIEKARLMQEVDGIGTSKEKYRQFARYIEALVAYHKYMGGRD